MKDDDGNTYEDDNMDDEEDSKNIILFAVRHVKAAREQTSHAGEKIKNKN